MRLRRMLAVAAAALAVAPVVMHAQDVDDDASESELRVEPFFGAGQYTDCSGGHSLQYGGLGASFDHRPSSNDTLHLRFAGAVVHEQDVLYEGNGEVTTDTRTGYGALAQIGADWTHFGFLLGAGLYSLHVPNARGLLPLPSLTLRFGNRRAFHVLFSILDDPSFVRSVAALDAVTVIRGVTLKLGVHVSPVVTAAPLAVVQIETRMGPVTLGVGGGVSLAQPTSAVAHLGLLHRF